MPGRIAVVFKKVETPCAADRGTCMSIGGLEMGHSLGSVDHKL